MNKSKIIIVCVCLISLIYILNPSSYEIKNSNPSGENIICFGDSLTYGTGAEEGMDYPSQLSRMIGEPVLNLGVPGDTNASALKRIDEVIEQDPRIVLVTLGGNDLRKGISKDDAFKNLEIIVLQIQGRGAMVVIGGIDIPFLGKGFDDAYESLAEKTGSVLVPNVLKGIWGKKFLMSDQIHPNSKGYTIMAEYFYDAVEPYL